MVEIKKIHALSFAKIIALVWIFIGFILGFGVGFISFIFGSVIGGMSTGHLSASGAWLGIGGFILIPILFGIIGFLLGLLLAWFYNLLSWWVGGMRIEISTED